MKHFPVTHNLSGETAKNAERQIHNIVKCQALLYTKGESGSLPVEIIEELRDSVYFTMHQGMLESNGKPIDCHALFQEGQQVILKKPPIPKSYG